MKTDKKGKGKLKTPERIKNGGFLIVISGPSGAGKDTVIQKFLEHQTISSFGIIRAVTCATREKREDEIDGFHYYFITKEKLDEMKDNNLLVEEPVEYGGSYKATPRVEIEKVIAGERLIWRIEPGLATDVGTGKFFYDQFPNEADFLIERTVVFCIEAPEEHLVKRRLSRDKESHNDSEYQKRDSHDAKFLTTLRKVSKVVVNEVNQADLTVEQLIENVIKHPIISKLVNSKNTPARPHLVRHKIML